MSLLTSKERFKRKMKEICDDSGEFDREIAHFDADELMMELLKELGYSEGVEIFDKMPKWYA